MIIKIGPAPLLRVPDWKETYIQRSKLWKTNENETVIERLGLCARWGAMHLFTQLSSKYHRRRAGYPSANKEDEEKDIYELAVNSKTKVGGKAVLHWAVQYGNLGMVKKLISDLGADANLCTDIHSFTIWQNESVFHNPLTLASEGGYLEIVHYLLSRSEVVCELKQAVYCLIVASENGHIELIKFWLEKLALQWHYHGDDDEIEDNEANFNGEAISLVGIRDDEEEELLIRGKLCALEKACGKGFLGAVKQLIGLGKIDLRSWTQERKCEFNGLILACDNGHLGIARELIENGVNVNFRENGQRNGWTALHYAAKRSKLALIKELIGAGADPNLTVSFDGENGLPPGVLAHRYNRNREVARYLRDLPSPLSLQMKYVLGAVGSFIVALLLVLAYVIQANV